MEKLILVRYGELSLKKDNRKIFINKVNHHIIHSLKDFPNITFESRGLRFYIHLNGTSVEPVIEILKKIPGIHSFSEVIQTETKIESMQAVALEVIQEAIKKGVQTIKVDTHRALKTFPLNSTEITKTVSRHLFKEIPGLKADMYHPEFTLYLDVRPEGTYLFSQTIKGLGGFPSGSLGKGLLMISGGIDSVVAGYLSLKKGIKIEAIHFASPPFTSDLALQKVIDLVEKLTPYTYEKAITLHVVPFTTIQKAIYDYTREDYGVTLMRRMMYRISQRIASNRNALALINGESVGQVASQTLESMNTIGEVVSIPVLRPLAMLDKQEIVDIATTLDTYDISIRPHEDCCTIFVPKHPQIKPRKSIAKLEESKFAFEELIEEAIKNTKVIELTSDKHYQVIPEIPVNIF